MSGSPQMGAVPPAPADEIRPPTTEVGVIGWLHHNLFNSKASGVATIVIAVILLLVVFLGFAQSILPWVFVITAMALLLVMRAANCQEEIFSRLSVI